MMADSNPEDEERLRIREELSSMSFEQLQKLKQKLGTKVFNEAVHGTKKIPKTKFKRLNKNRPREMSSKIPLPAMKDFVIKQKLAPRDPRFDSLCGEFNEKAFRSAYSFVSEYRKTEVQQLKQELEKTEDPDRKEQLKYLIQRMENQLREEKRRKEKAEKEREQHEARLEAMKRGEKVHFRTKSEKKVVELVDRFENLKQSGRLNKHMEKYRKKNLAKDRRKMAAGPSFR